MSNPIKIAVDAMGGENSPAKVIKGIEIHNYNSNNIFYNIFGDVNLIKPHINKTKISENNFELIHTDNNIKDDDSPLTAAKKGKNTSMWLSIESLKKNTSHAIVSAGNTGALFVIAKLNIAMIKNIDKPALSALWPNKNGMNVVLDLGANVECDEKNLVQFAFMGQAFANIVMGIKDPSISLLNIGEEEQKGLDYIKEASKILYSLNKQINYENQLLSILFKLSILG